MESFGKFQFPLLPAIDMDQMTLPASNDLDQSNEILNTAYFPILKPKGYFNLNTNGQGLKLEKFCLKKLISRNERVYDCRPSMNSPLS